MSERRMAERHEFLTHDGAKVAAVKDHEFPGFALDERDDSVAHGHLLEAALAEILRLRGERDALGTALLRYVVGDDCGCSDGSPDQPPAKQCAFCEAQAALRASDLLPEEAAS